MRTIFKLTGCFLAALVVVGSVGLLALGVLILRYGSYKYPSVGPDAMESLPKRGKAA